MTLGLLVKRVDLSQVCEFDDLSKVSELIDVLSMKWKHDLILRIFNERDQRCILSIPLSGRFSSDSLTWAYSKGGLYSTKTTYMLEKGGDLENFHEAWMEIWGMEYCQS